MDSDSVQILTDEVLGREVGQEGPRRPVVGKPTRLALVPAAVALDGWGALLLKDFARRYGRASRIRRKSQWGLYAERR
jgi:hypothetical protein